MATALKEHLERLAPSQEKTTAPSFEEIELTPEEEQEAIRRGREEKFYRLRREEYWQKLNAEPPVITYTPKELFGRLRVAKNANGKPFVYDNDNRDIVKLLCQYFAADPAFETGELKLSKGLALMGNVGVGKTFLMAFFSQNQNQSYVMANCRKIEGTWIEQMSNKDKPLKNVIDVYSGPLQASVNTNPFGQQVLGYCFDDLGTETSPSKSYGEEKNVLGEILMNRYESGLPFNYTHITTNLSAHDVGIKYGSRVRDRFREMFNLIQFDNNAKSRRI